MTKSHPQHTVQRRVHPTDVDQQTDHGHGYGRGDVLGELLLQYLAALAALGHGIDIDFGKRVTLGSIRVLCKDFLLVLKDQTQEVVLNVLPP